MPISIETEINKSIKARNDLRQSKRTNEISISKLGGCLRQMIMQERDYDKKPEYIPFTDRQLRVFACGYQFEYFTLDLLQDCIAERQIPAEYRGIKGTADAIIKDGADRILIDVKSCNSMKFKYLTSEPDEGYAMQLGTYWLALKDKFNLSPVVRLVYEDRDNLMIKEIGFTVGKWKNLIDAKIDAIGLARKDEGLPVEMSLDAKGNYPWNCFSCSKQNGVRLWCQYISFCPNVYKSYLAKGGKNDTQM